MLPGINSPRSSYPCWVTLLDVIESYHTTVQLKMVGPTLACISAKKLERHTACGLDAGVSGSCRDKSCRGLCRNFLHLQHLPRNTGMHRWQNSQGTLKQYTITEAPSKKAQNDPNMTRFGALYLKNYCVNREWFMFKLRVSR